MIILKQEVISIINKKLKIGMSTYTISVNYHLYYFIQSSEET